LTVLHRDRIKNKRGRGVQSTRKKGVDIGISFFCAGRVESLPSVECKKGNPTHAKPDEDGPPERSNPLEKTLRRVDIRRETKKNPTRKKSLGKENTREGHETGRISAAYDRKIRKNADAYKN